MRAKRALRTATIPVGLSVPVPPIATTFQGCKIGSHRLNTPLNTSRRHTARPTLSRITASNQNSHPRTYWNPRHTRTHSMQLPRGTETPGSRRAIADWRSTVRYLTDSKPVPRIDRIAGLRPRLEIQRRESHQEFVYSASSRKTQFYRDTRASGQFRPVWLSGNATLRSLRNIFLVASVRGFRRYSGQQPRVGLHEQSLASRFAPLTASRRYFHV